MEKARCGTHGWSRFSPFASTSFLRTRFLHLRSASPSPSPFTPLPLSIPHSLYIKPYVMFGLRHHLYSAMPHALPVISPISSFVSYSSLILNTKSVCAFTTGTTAISNRNRSQCSACFHLHSSFTPSSSPIYSLSLFFMFFLFSR